MKGQPYLRPPLALKLGERIPGYAVSAVPPLLVGRYEARVNAGGVSASTRFLVTKHNIIE